MVLQLYGREERVKLVGEIDGCELREGHRMFAHSGISKLPVH